MSETLSEPLMYFKLSTKSTAYGPKNENSKKQNKRGKLQHILLASTIQLVYTVVMAHTGNNDVKYKKATQPNFISCFFGQKVF